MGRTPKTILYFIAGAVALLVIGAFSFLLLFDPNDYRDDIAVEVKLATGRELIIEGDVEVSIFPWLAIEIGRTRLGNGAGFGDEPFASFERASLSVRLMPLLLGGDLRVGTADLDSLQLTAAIGRILSMSPMRPKPHPRRTANPVTRQASSRSPVLKSAPHRSTIAMRRLATDTN
jgi:AsmA protein